MKKTIKCVAVFLVMATITLLFSCKSEKEKLLEKINEEPYTSVEISDDGSIISFTWECEAEQHGSAYISRFESPDSSVHEVTKYNYVDRFETSQITIPDGEIWELITAEVRREPEGRPSMHIVTTIDGRKLSHLVREANTFAPGVTLPRLLLKGGDTFLIYISPRHIGYNDTTVTFTFSASFRRSNIHSSDD